jgi:PleD family two-component response regulator
MISAARRILVVTSTSRMARTVTSCLGDREVLLATSYSGAKLQLTCHPDVVITEVKLGAYNGLQLALRGQIAGIPTIVLGPDDVGFAEEAERLGATYVVADALESEDLADTLGKAIDRATVRVH